MAYNSKSLKSLKNIAIPYTQLLKEVPTVDVSELTLKDKSFEEMEFLSEDLKKLKDTPEDEIIKIMEDSLVGIFYSFDHQGKEKPLSEEEKVKKEINEKNVIDVLDLELE